MIDQDVWIRSDYENVYAVCPGCGREVIFNRVSDLKTTERIFGLDIDCLFPECGTQFRIVGDSINESYEMMLFHGGQLFNQKRYMQCVMQTCQAYEMFFNLHIYAELVCRPWSSVKNTISLAALNKRSNDLHKAIKKFSFQDMRNLSLLVAIKADQSRPFDASSAAEFIQSIRAWPQKPTVADVGNIPGRGIAEHFLRIKRSTINIERNKVAHKRAYRPNRECAEMLLVEARETLFPLAYALKIKSNIAHY